MFIFCLRDHVTLGIVLGFTDKLTVRVVFINRLTAILVVFGLLGGIAPSVRVQSVFGVLDESVALVDLDARPVSVAVGLVGIGVFDLYGAVSFVVGFFFRFAYPKQRTF